jgi:hypothetical protein
MRSMLCVLLALVEQTLCNARLGRECRFGQGLMIRQRRGRRAQTRSHPAHGRRGHFRAYRVEGRAYLLSMSAISRAACPAHQLPRTPRCSVNRRAPQPRPPCPTAAAAVPHSRGRRAPQPRPPCPTAAAAGQQRSAEGRRVWKGRPPRPGSRCGVAVPVQLRVSVASSAMASASICSANSAASASRAASASLTARIATPAG